MEGIYGTKKDTGRILFLSTYGKNPEDTNAGIVRFLNFVKADLKESSKDFHDELVQKIQNSITHIKHSVEILSVPL